MIKNTNTTLLKVPDLARASRRMLHSLNSSMAEGLKPGARQRIAFIGLAHEHGASMSTIGAYLGISRQRVHQVVHDFKGRKDADRWRASASSHNWFGGT